MMGGDWSGTMTEALAKLTFQCSESAFYSSVFVVILCLVLKFLSLVKVNDGWRLEWNYDGSIGQTDQLSGAVKALSILAFLS